MHRCIGDGAEHDGRHVIGKERVLIRTGEPADLAMQLLRLLQQKIEHATCTMSCLKSTNYFVSSRQNYEII